MQIIRTKIKRKKIIVGQSSSKNVIRPNNSFSQKLCLCFYWIIYSHRTWCNILIEHFLCKENDYCFSRMPRLRLMRLFQKNAIVPPSSFHTVFLYAVESFKNFWTIIKTQKHIQLCFMLQMAMGRCNYS